MSIYTSLLAIFFRMLVPVSIIGIIVALVAVDSSKKARSAQGTLPPQFDAQGRPIPQKRVEGRFNTSSVLMMIGTAFIFLAAVTFVASNWMKLSNEAKVFVILGAAILSFAISVVVKAVVKLDLTSAGFYLLGTTLSVVSLVTAGNYQLLGEWYSVSGDGMGLLFATASFFVAGACFAAYPLYRKMAFNYFGLSCISFALIFLAVQITDNYEQFAPVIVMAQFIITAAIHLLKPQKGTFLEKPVSIIGDITAVLYDILAFFYVLATTFKATPFTFFVLGVIMVQFLVYGIFKKQGWMIVLLNMTAYYAAFTALVGLDNDYSAAFLMILFSLITLAIFVMNVFIPKNSTASKAITFSVAVFGAILSLCANNDRYFGVNVIVPLVMSGFILAYTMHKEIAVQVTAGLAAPVLPFFSALFLSNRFYELNGREQYAEIKVLTFGTLSIIYIAIAAALMYLPKYAFNIHAHHPMKSEVTVYSFMIASAAIMLNCTRYSSLFMAAVAVCIIHFIVSNLMSCNVTAAGSIVSLILIVSGIFRHFFGSGSDVVMYSMFGLFVVLMAVSKLVFAEGFLIKKNGRTMVDVIILSAWICMTSYMNFNRLSVFLTLMSVAVFIACFIKKNTEKEAAAILLSLSSFIAAFACITRPFLTTDSSIINSKITLGIIALLGVSYRYIWKQHRAASRVTSTILYVISFVGLIIDAMVYHSAPNTIFAMGVTAGILLIAFYSKNMTWFSVSSIALVVITVYATHKYFATMGWWIYLFIVGVVLIVVAAVNEYCKKKGDTIKSAATKTFSEWKW